MADRPNPDDFDQTLRRALHDSSAAARPAPDLAARLVANARAGGPAVVSLAARRRVSRWGLPLLAAASVVLLTVGAAIGVTLIDNHHDIAPPPATEGPTGSPTRSAPASPTEASSTAAPTSARPTSSGDPNRPVVLPPVPDHFRAVDARMTDPSHGWALGDGRCATSAANDCPALITTTNGGDSWHAMKLPTDLVSTFDQASCGTNGDVSGRCVDHVLFADASHGYVWSLHEFYGTTDGGKSWTRAPHDANGWAGASQVVLSGSQAVRLAAVEPCSSGCPGIIQVAPAGSMQWQTESTGSKPVALFGSRLTGHGADLYLFAGETADSASAGILHSSDGGRTWGTLAAHPCGPVGSGGDSFQGDGTVGEDGAIAAQCYGSGAQPGVRTAAAGSSTFSAFRALPVADSGFLLVHADGDGTVLATLRGEHEDIAALYVTHDGGQTWSVRSRPAGLDGFLRFMSAQDGYVLGTDQVSVLVTHDGGASWQRVTFR